MAHSVTPVRPPDGTALRLLSRPLLALLLGLAVARCAPARAPEIPRTLPPVPAGIERDAVGKGFRYAPGSVEYGVESEAMITVRGDTGAADTVLTTARIRYRLEEGSLPRRVTGAVDAFEVRRAGRVSDSTMLDSGITFDGELTDSGLEFPAVLEPLPMSSIGDTSTAPAFVCRAPTSPPLALARELLIGPPSSLDAGHTWTDTTISTVCRGGVPVTTTADHRYTILGPASHLGRRVIEIRRTSELAIAGRGEQGGRALAVTGDGQAVGTYYADPVAGSLLAGSAEYTANITFESGTRRQQFVQRVRQQVRLLRQGGF